MTPKIILYGIGGASDSYRPLKYWLIHEEITIEEILYQAHRMAEANPSIIRVYAVDNSRRLYWDFKELTKCPSIEACVIFKDVLENRGLLIYERKEEKESQN